MWVLCRNPCSSPSVRPARTRSDRHVRYLPGVSSRQSRGISKATHAERTSVPFPLNQTFLLPLHLSRWCYRPPGPPDGPARASYGPRPSSCTSELSPVGATSPPKEFWSPQILLYLQHHLASDPSHHRPGRPQHLPEVPPDFPYPLSHSLSTCQRDLHTAHAELGSCPT